MIVDQLKQQTRSYHLELEHSLALLTRPIERDEYQALLQRLWGFYQPLEQRLAATCAATDLVRWDERWKAPWLAQDLQALGLARAAIDALPRAAALPPCDTLAAALGCWYVLEGATLGGQLIARQLYPRLGLTPTSGGAFFISYDAQVGPMWQRFCVALTSYATTAERQAAMIAAACATFYALDQWLFATDALMRAHRNGKGAAARVAAVMAQR